jgi:hypothetical protein
MMRKLLLSCLAGALIAPLPAAAQPRSDQGEARKEMQAGNILRSRDGLSAEVHP